MSKFAAGESKTVRKNESELCVLTITDCKSCHSQGVALDRLVWFFDGPVRYVTGGGWGTIGNGFADLPRVYIPISGTSNDKLGV